MELTILRRPTATDSRNPSRMSVFASRRRSPARMIAIGKEQARTDDDQGHAETNDLPGLVRARLFGLIHARGFRPCTTQGKSHQLAMQGRGLDVQRTAAAGHDAVPGRARVRGGKRVPYGLGGAKLREIESRSGERRMPIGRA